MFGIDDELLWQTKHFYESVVRLLWEEYEGVTRIYNHQGKYLMLEQVFTEARQAMMEKFAYNDKV